MSSSNLIRLSGLAAVVASVLLLIGDLLAFATEPENLSEWATSPSYVFVWLLFLLGAVLLLAGLVGLYVASRKPRALGVCWLPDSLLGHGASVGHRLGPALRRSVPGNRGS